MNIQAPALVVSQWLNADHDITLEGLRGHVVMIEAFQMLCPGCVAFGLPQAQRVRSTFGNDVQVLGLHTVFEHHRAMSPVSLEAFLQEYKITFPVAVDQHETGNDSPVTMRRYQLQGTPSTIVIDRSSRIRARSFGQHDDLSLGALLGRLCDESSTTAECDPALGCPAPTTEPEHTS